MSESAKSIFRTADDRKKDRHVRASGSKNSDIRAELRSEAERDLDRLLYTYYMRRLAEITQVASYVPPLATGLASGAAGLPHNRLTHSLKVGQVARRLCQYLQNDPDNQPGIDAAGGLDANVAEAAGRAHDLGHPPYGHVGEEVLDEIARDAGLVDGFEGNAQTLRILAALVRRGSNEKGLTYNGLDCTAATLSACVKYPWPRGTTGKRFRKYGYIDLDRTTFEEQIKPQLYLDGVGVLEAQVMDWADDITYATHDIEDFAMGGTIPLVALRHRPEGQMDSDPEYIPQSQSEFEAFWAYASAKLGANGKVPSSEAKKEFRRLAASFPKLPPDGSRTMEAHLGRISSYIITLTSNATRVLPNGKLDIDEPVRSLVDVLKQLTWYYVIDRPDTAVRQRGQRKRLEAVTRELIAWCEEAFAVELPTPLGCDDPPRQLNIEEQTSRRGVLPPLLRELTDALLTANNRRGAYEGEPRKNIIRAVIDFVASLREVEIDEYYKLMCA